MRIVNPGMVPVASLTVALMVGCVAVPSDVVAGDSCYDIEDVVPGFSDGCMLGVGVAYDLVDGSPTAPDGVIGLSLLVNQDMKTGKFSVGTSGSLGSGVIMGNQGTLTRENAPALSGHPACTWQQNDRSLVTITGTDTFDLAVTESLSGFAPACPPEIVPAGGACTSTWTWHMQKTTNKTRTPASDPPCR